MHQLTWSGELARHAAWVDRAVRQALPPLPTRRIERNRVRGAQRRDAVLQALADGKWHTGADIFDVADAAGFTRFSTRNGLLELVRAGRVVAHGVTTGRVYRLSEDPHHAR